MPTHETFQLVRARPSMMQRIGSQIRSYWSGPITSKSPELAKYFGGYGPTQSGVNVTEDSALTASPVWSAVTMISDDIASLPLNLYKRSSGGGKERYDSHPLYRLLHDAPNPEMDSMVMRRVMQTHALLWQNAYAEIERDAIGRPVAMWPLCPEYVTPFRENGALKYRYQGPTGVPVIFDPIDMIHLVGQSHDGTVGCSLVQKARESFGMLLAAEKFGAAFFGNGMTFGGVLSYPGTKPPELSEEGYRKTLEARHQGVERAYKILAVYNGGTFKSEGVKPNEGQFNETRIFQIREVARWFKMPPHKLGDLADATYSNVEQMDAAYMSSCIRPWLVLWQQQLSRKLIAPLERTQQFIEHDTHGFLSVDAAGRSALYKAEFDVGSITPNDIRGYENRNPLDGGDQAFVQLNLIPLNKVQPWWDLLVEEKKAQIEKLKQPPPPPPAPAPDPNAQQKDQTIASQARTISELTAAVDQASADTKRERDIRAASDMAFASEQIAHDGTRGQCAALSAEAERQATRADTAEARAQALAGRVLELEADKLLADAEVERQASILAATQSHRDWLGSDVDVLADALDAFAADRAKALARCVDLEMMHSSAVEKMEQSAVASTAAVAARVEAEAAAAQAIQRAEQAERDRVIALQAQQAANTALEEIRAREVKRLSDAIAAHRALMVDAMGRIITKESDRARKAQATPEKLRHWIDAFYVTHEDTCVEALLPAIRTHLAWSQSADDPNTVTRRLMREHVAESVRQLRTVANGDPDDLHVSLERLMQRWEVERPAALADLILRDEVEYVRSL